MRYATIMRNSFLFACLLAAVLATFAADDAKPQETPMSILPAPKPVTIDGNLKEWDLGGKLGPVSFDEEAFDEYHATFYAMYDQENLYLAAVVVEPHLPFNTYPNSGRCDWCGDDVNIRMSTRPGNPANWPRDVPDADKSPELWNGKFWWNHKERASRWQGYRGMNMDGNKYTTKELPGVLAAVKLAQDGHGYTLEIKMPWASLNAEAPRPKAGDSIALLFETVIGTDNKVEPTRMFQIFGNAIGAGTNAFRDYHGWGKAIFK